jgi:hypothetical protein
MVPLHLDCETKLHYLRNDWIGEFSNPGSHKLKAHQKLYLFPLYSPTILELLDPQTVTSFKKDLLPCSSLFL